MSPAEQMRTDPLVYATCDAKQTERVLTPPPMIRTSLLTLLLAAPLAAQPVDTTTFTISTAVVGTLDSRLFGQMAERPSWGGKRQETGPEAAWDDASGGLDSSVVRLIDQMDIPVVRWPGGTDVDHMNWTDMIDNAPDRDDPDRPMSIGRTGESVSNRFGVDEALTLFTGQGSEIILVANLRDALAGFKTIEEAARHAAGMIAYANAPVGADLPDGMPDWPAIRAQNGRTEPWRVDYFQIGNETWLHRDADGEILIPNEGEISLEIKERYFDSIHAYIAAVRAVDPSIRIIVDGSMDAVIGDFRSQFGDALDYVSIHQYYPWSMRTVVAQTDTVADARSWAEAIRTRERGLSAHRWRRRRAAS